MKLNVMFIIATIALTLIGILSFLAPLAPAAALGTTDANAGWQSMLGGAAFLPLGIIAWLVRNAEASKTRDALVLGYTLLFALMAVVSLYGRDLPGHQAFWVTTLIQALFAVGFFVAGMSSKSAQTS